MSDMGKGWSEKISRTLRVGYGLDWVERLEAATTRSVDSELVENRMGLVLWRRRFMDVMGRDPRMDEVAGVMEKFLPRSLRDKDGSLSPEWWESVSSAELFAIDEELMGYGLTRRGELVEAEGMIFAAGETPVGVNPYLHLQRPRQCGKTFNNFMNLFSKEVREDLEKAMTMTQEPVTHELGIGCGRPPAWEPTPEECSGSRHPRYQEVMEEVETELNDIDLNRPWPADRTHQAANVAEEGGEVLQAANNFRENGEGEDLIYYELVQTAAVAIKALLRWNDK